MKTEPILTEVDQDFNADRCPARSSTGHRCQASTEPHDWHVHGPLRWTDPRVTTEQVREHMKRNPNRGDFRPKRTGFTEDA